MELGMTIPVRGSFANAEGIAAHARRGEELGFTMMAIPDHIVVPKEWEHVYPYEKGGYTNVFSTGEHLEPVSLMAAVAGMTTKARIMPAVMVVPYRPAVLTARQIATIDVASGGRITVGCGTGWMREEFEAVDAPPFEHRGRVTDEFIKAFRELWTNEEPEFDGEFVRFSNIYSKPLPIQRPHPPIWIGGDSTPAMRRVVRLGDGWFPVGADDRGGDPRYPLNTLERYGAAVKRLHEIADGGGRDPGSITLAFWAVWYADSDDRRQVGQRAHSVDGEDHMLLGSSEKVASDILAMGEMGVTTIVFNFVRDTLEESQASMERFASEIMPLVRAG